MKKTNARPLSYPFPLRPDLTIEIANLPRDLTAEECAKICAFIRTLIVPSKEEGK